MRRVPALALIVSTLLAAAPARASLADSPGLAGSWKLVVIPNADLELAILDLTPAEGVKVAARVANANERLMGPFDAAGANLEGDRIAIRLLGWDGGPSRILTFRGTLDPDGNRALGTVRFPGGVLRGRIERTVATAVSPPSQKPSKLVTDLDATRSIRDLKERCVRVLELVGAHPGDPINAVAYDQIVRSAEAAGLSAEEVKQAVGRWLDEARPYGPDWVGETQAQVLRALEGKKAYASLGVEVGHAAEKSLPPDASLNQRSALANLLARSAALAGDEATAAEAAGRAREYDASLDAEYEAKVPPFPVKPYAGRPGGQGSRVELMELFTGAECGPCVAPDVAFDALLKTFQPSEFIGLQYHLHIPRPDPLTNADTVGRADGYYTGDVLGTPTVFLNGNKFASSGGFLPEARDRYSEFRRVIDPDLTERKLADVELVASRSGDEVKVVAKARASTGPRPGRPRLRVVLIEKTVRYPGGNKIRLHRNVVRAFPGGVDGRPLDDAGQATVEVTVRLGEVRKAQEDSLKTFTQAGNRPFPNPLPPVDLDDLAVVAFVQNDVDHTVWHAVQADVAEGKP